MLKKSADRRAVEYARFITENAATVRCAAARFGVSKSTVHKYITRQLPCADPALYAQVRDVLERNKAQRHLRGGAATRRKYLTLRQEKSFSQRESQLKK